jgi:hypothetical protein
MQAFTPTVPTSQIKFEVNEAMNYFNQNARYKGERQDEELLSPIIAGQPEPLWDLATDGMIQTVIGDYAFIEVPLKSQKGTFGMMNWGSYLYQNICTFLNKLTQFKHFLLKLYKFVQKMTEK